MKLERYTLAFRHFFPWKGNYLSTFLLSIIFIARLNNISYGQQNKTRFEATEVPGSHPASYQLKQSTDIIWFEKNMGQHNDNKILYSFTTSFGSMAVFKNKLRVVSRQEKGKSKGVHIIDISFPGSNARWEAEGKYPNAMSGSYYINNKKIIANIYNELILKNVYNGIDLRLYSGEKGALEFDWLVKRAADYHKIKMKFNGQNKLITNNDGSLELKLALENMKIMIPESYQLIGGNKVPLTVYMQQSAGSNTISYGIKEKINPEHPLVIDPVMTWSTYMHNNSRRFDEYLYTVAANSSNEIYACGLTNEIMSSSYLSGVAPGFLSTYTFATTSSGKEQSAILYKLDPTGTRILAWTYTGIGANIPVAMSIFPDNRVLVVYQRDTIQIFSPDLNTRQYNDVISSTAVASKVTAYQSVTIADNNTFYLGGIANLALPSSVIPSNAPDNTIGGNEAVILKITNASTTPTVNWGTYVGGSTNETFTAIALTPNKRQLAFAVHAETAGTNYPARVNPVDNTIAGSELLVGSIDLGDLTAFKTFSFLGGSSNEGTSATISAAALVTADNTYMYVAGNTTSSSLPGTAGAAQPAHGINTRLYDQFVSRIPLNGSAGSGFVTTYSGGNDNDLVGGLVIDSRTNDVLLFGTSESSDYPVLNSVAASPFFQGTHGSFANGTRDITYTIFKNDLTVRKYSTYIGGAHDDYLGSTGKLQGTGHFQFSNYSGLTYIGTTIHSDETTVPRQWISDIPGFDKSIPTATTGKDNHFIFAINPNTSDFGDAPASYDGSDPASSAVSFYNIRIGLTTDAEPKNNSSVLANGDDRQNYGSADDEDGITTAPSMYPFTTTYTVGVSTFNNTGAPVQLCGWIDTDGNGQFDSYEYTTATVLPADSQQNTVLTFTGLPPFMPVGGVTYLRIRMSSDPMTAASATGAIGKGEVEDYIVPQAVILPVVMQQFTAVPLNSKSLLSWSVAQQQDIVSFDVEYSRDNRLFNAIKNIAVNNTGNYSFTHDLTVRGSNFYRIRINNRDGSKSYSAANEVKFDAASSIGIYPNPVTEQLYVAFNENAGKKALISLFSSEGKQLMNYTITATKPVETIATSQLPTGYYFIRVESEGKILTRKINVIK